MKCRLHQCSHLQHKRLFWCASVAVNYGCQSASKVEAAVKSLFGLTIRSCWAIKKSTCTGKQWVMCLWLCTICITMLKSLVPNCASRDIMVPVSVWLVLGSPATSMSPLRHSLGSTWPENSTPLHFSPQTSCRIKKRAIKIYTSFFSYLLLQNWDCIHTEQFIENQIYYIYKKKKKIN